MSYIFLLLSLVLYYLAPLKYNFAYAVLCLIVYILCFIFIYKKYKKNIELVSLFTIFSFTFFLSNFIFPVFIYPFFPVELVFTEAIDYNLIMRGEVLSLIGYCSIALGMNLYFKKTRNHSNELPYIAFKKTLKYALFTLVLVYALILYLSLGSSYQAYHEFSSTFLTIYSIMMMMFALYVNHVIYIYRKEKIRTIIIKNFGAGIVICFLIYALTIVGDRGPIMQLIITMIIAYNLLVQKIPLKKILIIGICGISLMVFIRDNRTDGQYKDSIEYRNSQYGVTLPAYIDAFTDFVFASRAMYLGLEYTERNGFLHGKTVLRDILSPIPFLPTLVYSVLFNEKPSENSTGYLISREANATYGLGANAVVDIYMNFGVIGVLIILCTFGYFIGYLESNKRKNVYLVCCYCVLGFTAIYLPRNNIFETIRLILWTCALIAIFKNNKRNEDSYHRQLGNGN